MKKIILLFAFIACLLLHINEAFAQSKKPAKQPANVAAIQKKYPSLLWEISGNGLQKPSYLFGTMHVSDKLVFNLDDSFYNAIKNVDVVAIEQNPEVWQEEYSITGDDDDEEEGMGGLYNFARLIDEHDGPRLTINTFSLSQYESRIKIALASEARMANSMLYRNQLGMEDFEEETYLDMYIFRLGYKLKKKVTGVENYKETNKLVREAYLAMYKDKNRKQRGFDYNDRTRVENAYRRGDLDLIDSIESANITSEVFEEKFMYKRNEIQAHSIDTIVKKNSLFVAVGVAHLPGKKGVIELLRQKGYTLRPVAMGQRNSLEKEKLDEVRVPVTFTRKFSDDSVFNVEVPGPKLFRYKNISNLNMLQYADMPNGSYYLITRVKTDAALRGQSSKTILAKIDSLLYENVPGKIVSKKLLNKNGFSGYDIVNKTKKGDEQRYNIFVLPNEIIFFKIAGIDNYLSQGDEADRFFASVKFDSAHIQMHPTEYEPPYGGFKTVFPAKPFFISQKTTGKTNQWVNSDEQGNTFFIYKANLHQYDYIEEDTFELRLMEESFLNSPVFKDKTPGKLSRWNNYPVINADYVHNDGARIKVRYLIQANNYYVIGAKHKNNTEAADRFINTFSFTPYYYGEEKKQADTTLGFTVNSPMFYKTAKDSSNDLSLPVLLSLQYDDDDNGIADLFRGVNAPTTKVVGNDTTGEYVDILSFRLPKYAYFKDSAALLKAIYFTTNSDSDFIIRSAKTYTNASNWLCYDYELADTGSSRVITAKSFYKNGVMFRISNMGDTIAKPGSFVKQFFESFAPADTFAVVDPFKKKSDIFFRDYFNTDSVTSRKAIMALSPLIFDSADLPQIKTAINALSWKKKNYMSAKKEWINVIGSFHDSASVNYLASLYHAVKDTSEFQNAVLAALLDMETATSFMAFKDLVVNDPPALNENVENYGDVNMRYIKKMIISVNTTHSLDENDFSSLQKRWTPLYDTLALSAGIIPGLMDLVTLDDYKDDVMELLAASVDSGYIKAGDYRQYLSKFLFEGKQELKKRSALEENRELRKLSSNSNSHFDYIYEDLDLDLNNNKDDLSMYATLLIPFWEQSAEVPEFFNKLLQLRDKQSKLEAAILMLKNNKLVPDSIFQFLATDDIYRARLYNQLDKNKQLNRFPAKYNNQMDIAKSVLYNAAPYARIDSLVYIDKLLIDQPGNKGWVYFFKFNKHGDNDEWFIATSGLQPLDTSKVNANTARKAYKFVGITNEEYKEPVRETFQKLMKRYQYLLRKSASDFYGYEGDNLDEFEVEAVKQTRYE